MQNKKTIAHKDTTKAIKTIENIWTIAGLKICHNN